jgi:membrane protein implicated in regulation of membrane protease activity
MSTLNSAKLYARVALLRRQVLLRQMIRRAIAGALAVAAFIVTAGFATYAMFLAIRVPLGDLSATLAIAGFYLVVALVLLAYTLREPHSPELEALSEMEATALETITADSQGVVQMMNAAGNRIENFGNSMALGVGILSVLRKLLSSRKS